MRYRSKMSVIVLFAVVFSITGLLLLITTSFFRVKKVIIISKQYPISGLNILNHKNLLFSDFLGIQNQLKNSNYFVKSVQLNKVFPDGLAINIELRSSMAAVHTKSAGFSADNEGYILPEIKNTDLPQIDIGGGILYIGNKGDWRIFKALDILDKSKNEGINITQILYDSDKGNFFLTLTGGTLVLVPSQMDASQLVTSLQLIVSRFRIEGKNIKKIDFNYGKPVVVLANEEKNSSK